MIPQGHILEVSMGFRCSKLARLNGSEGWLEACRCRSSFVSDSKVSGDSGFFRVTDFGRTQRSSSFSKHRSKSEVMKKIKLTSRIDIRNENLAPASPRSRHFCQVSWFGVKREIYRKLGLLTIIKEI